MTTSKPSDSVSDELLKEKVAKILGLKKGGITGHPSPANAHWYFVNEVEDLETEQLIMTQRINFEEELNDLTAFLLAWRDSLLKSILSELPEESTREFSSHYILGQESMVREVREIISKHLSDKESES